MIPQYCGTLISSIRQSTWLPLDEVWEMVLIGNPSITRSVVYRTFVLAGVNKVPEKEKDKAKKFKEYEPGYLHIDVTYLPKIDGIKYYLFVAIDRATRTLYYEMYDANDFSIKRKYRKKAVKSIDKNIVRTMTFLLNCDWSPEQICKTCKKRNIEMLSIEAIYVWIYGHREDGKDYTHNLRRHHRKRRKRRLTNQPRVIIKDKKSIHDRPLEVAAQTRFGDFEADLMKCKNGYLVNITERKSLYNIIEMVTTKEAISVQNAIIKALDQFKENIKTITSDNGTEFANHQQIAQQLQTQWYFADTYKSQQRGCNENQNGLIRQYFKRDTDLNFAQLKF